MSSVSIQGNASGTGIFTIASPNSNTNRTLTLPDATGTIITTAGGAAISGTTGSFTTTVGVGGATPAASGAGITFPATQSASSDANTLDDYEEGTWTPSLAFGGAASGQTGTFAGFYTKVGNQVFATCLIDLTAKGSSTGVVSIRGLPFTSNSNANYRALSSTIVWGSFATNYVYMLGLVGSNATQIDIYAATAATASSAGSTPSNTDVNNTSSFRISITYQTS